MSETKEARGDNFDVEMLAAWCFWKRREVDRTRVMIDRDGELELVDAIEGLIVKWREQFAQRLASQERERVLREALEFYSLGIVWKHADFASASDAEYDSGRIARQALERAGRE